MMVAVAFRSETEVDWVADSCYNLPAKATDEKPDNTGSNADKESDRSVQEAVERTYNQAGEKLKKEIDRTGLDQAVRDTQHERSKK